jgi:hypothetical protein
MERLQQWFHNYRPMTNEQISDAVEYRLAVYLHTKDKLRQRLIYQRLVDLCEDIDITQMLPKLGNK